MLGHQRQPVNPETSGSILHSAASRRVLFGPPVLPALPRPAALMLVLACFSETSCVMLGVRHLDDTWAPARSRTIVGIHAPIPVRTLSKTARLHVPVEVTWPVPADSDEPRITEISTGLTVWMGAPVYSPDLFRDQWTEEAVIFGRGRAWYAGAGLSYLDVQSDSSGGSGTFGGFLHIGYWRGFSTHKSPRMLGVELRYTFGTHVTFSGEGRDVDGLQLLFVMFSGMH